MGGKYIVNQTAGSKVIILEENDESIQGGYFDTEGEWHELSGPLDGNLEGRYVINETDGKRIILLEEDADSIGGGYFDQDGTWIPFTSTPTVYMEVNGEEFELGYALSWQGPNYKAANNKRLSYTKFDLPIEGGYRYHVVAESSVDTAQIGFGIFNQLAIDAVNNSHNITEPNQSDLGWNPLDTYIDVPAQLNGSDVVCVRMTSRYSESNPVIDSNYINKVTFYKGETL